MIETILRAFLGLVLFGYFVQVAMFAANTMSALIVMLVGALLQLFKEEK